MKVSGPPEEVMDRVSKAVLSLPGARIMEATETYLHARVKTPLFRFVDDLEVLLESGKGVVHIRSASRIGSWDLGANRRRVEWLRRRIEDPTPGKA